MEINNFDFDGLSDQEILASRAKSGKNIIVLKNENNFFNSILKFLKDPMILLLFAASIIYFVSGKTADAIFLAAAIVIVSSISSFQNARSRNALSKLKNFTKPNCDVIRNRKIVAIKTEDLVLGDYLVLAEGSAISADGIIVHSSDFSLNESILTGESMPVSKDKSSKDNIVHQGTTVATGQAVAIINAIGNNTKLGKIGHSLEQIKEEKTPLELQIGAFVKKMAIAGGLVFMIVWAINYFRSFNVLDSLLNALTLAMSILPEEIPIAFTTFMAIGAWRMMKKGIIVKQMKTVETLGSATVICIDKTGTITENKMSLAKIFTLKSNKISDLQNDLSIAEGDLISLAMWASEPVPFDPMDLAIHDAYSKKIKTDDRQNFKLIHEYPLSGRPPMMTHVFENKSKTKIIAAKGGSEAIIESSKLSAAEQNCIFEAIKILSTDGYRILAVGQAVLRENLFPKTQQEFTFEFKGLLAFYDPPKSNIADVLKHFYDAGIKVKIITGDNAETTASIAKQIGFRGFENSISGDDLMHLSDVELKQTVLDVNLFTRMFPEAKLKIINALKVADEIVSMTGDGVNDGPALKAAHIGVAMGKQGTEIAKQAASLIIIDDDLSKMVYAISMGRKIYGNLKKAIQFIISIHIPIILTVFIPLAFSWKFPNIFSPIHIIFLELIMGPTCSVVYENEPLEKNAMLQKPRLLSETFFNWKELSISIIQGLAITIGTLSCYQYAIYHNFSESRTRTMVFVVLVTANIFLTLVNRSFYYSIFTTLKYKNNLIPIIIGVTLGITTMLVYVVQLSNFFGFEPLRLGQMGIAVGTGAVSVLWFELLKWYNRISKNNSQ